MMEFFEKNLVFFIVVIIVGSFVTYSVNKERRDAEKKQENDKQKTTEENQKDKNKEV